MRPRVTSRRLFIEQLESREVPAGNVTGQMVGDALVVTGDQFDNYVQLRQDAAGIHLGEQLYNGVNNVVIDTGSGEDFVSLVNLSLPGNLSIDTGAGWDAVSAHWLSVEGDVEIHTGANGLGTQGSGAFPGNSAEPVSLHLQNVGGTLTIDTGPGDDVVNIDASNSGYVAPIGNLIIDTGEGNDLVYLDSLEVRGTAWLDGGNGESDDLSAVFWSQSLTVTGFEQSVIIW